MVKSRERRLSVSNTVDELAEGEGAFGGGEACALLQRRRLASTLLPFQRHRDART
jgi:hypothetical protein